MRGAPRPDSHEVLEWRIIPADAGSTGQARMKSGRQEDHPRGCGEHLLISGLSLANQGSSPRMRGAHMITSPACRNWRIIPADAGSTALFRSVRQCAWDHPRGCGEHNIVGGMYDLKKGSSPRMRGARFRRPLHGPPRRIIPADAGSTGRLGAMDVRREDHPRGCGEHSVVVDTPMFYRGSSPRMRGAHEDDGQ